VLHQLSINKDLEDPLKGNWLFTKPTTQANLKPGNISDTKSMLSRMSVASRVSMSPSIKTVDLNRFKEQFMLNSNPQSQMAD
jgi:hypothetical protein